MKTKTLLVLGLLTAALALAQLPVQNDQTKFVLSSNVTSTALTVPIYNKVYLAGWIDIRGAQSAGKDYGQSITMADQGVFTQAATTITVKHSPSVRKNEDGTWTITFVSDGLGTLEEMKILGEIANRLTVACQKWIDPKDDRPEAVKAREQLADDRHLINFIANKHQP